MSDDDEDTFVPLDEPINQDVMARVRALSTSRAQEVNLDRQLTAAAQLLARSDAILVLAGDRIANTAALGKLRLTDFTCPGRKLASWQKVNMAIANASSTCCIGRRETEAWSELVGKERVFYVTSRIDSPFSYLAGCDAGPLIQSTNSLRAKHRTKSVFELRGSCNLLQCTGRTCSSTSFALLDSIDPDESAAKGTAGSILVAKDESLESSDDDDGEGDGMPDLDDGEQPSVAGGGSKALAEAPASVPPAKGQAGLPSQVGGIGGISDRAVPTCLECGSAARPNIALMNDSHWNRRAVDQGRQDYENWLRTLPQDCKLAIVDLDSASLDDDEVEDLREKAQFGFSKTAVVELNPLTKEERGSEKSRRTVTVRANPNREMLAKLHKLTANERNRMLAGILSEVHGDDLIETQQRDEDESEDEQQTTEEEMDDDSDDDSDDSDVSTAPATSRGPPVPPPRLMCDLVSCRLDDVEAGILQCQHFCKMLQKRVGMVRLRTAQLESNALLAEVLRLTARVDSTGNAVRKIEHGIFNA